MEPLLIKLSKTVSAITGDSDNYRLILSVTYAQGITDAIFVHQYLPGSPYAGPSETSFYNVAYPDELHTIPVNPPNRLEACYIRTNRIDRYFKSIEAIDSFMAVVTADISRLLSHLETFNDYAESTSSSITVTKDSKYEVQLDDISRPETPSTPSTCPCATASPVELITESVGTIIVDITGK